MKFRKYELCHLLKTWDKDNEHDRQEALKFVKVTEENLNKGLTALKTLLEDMLTAQREIFEINVKVQKLRNAAFGDENERFKSNVAEIESQLQALEEDIAHDRLRNREENKAWSERELINIKELFNQPSYFNYFNRILTIKDTSWIGVQSQKKLMILTSKCFTDVDELHLSLSGDLLIQKQL